MKKKNILVTNDDGIYGLGLKPLVSELRRIGNVTVVVPDQERSGTSHSITLHKPLRIQKLDESTYIANGTPTDCVRYGAVALLGGKVDLVVSGINTGPNLGQDVIYSGTVAGAREGTLMNIPSFSISVAEIAGGNFGLAAKYAGKIARQVLKEGLPENIYLNVNVPRKAKGAKFTTLGRRIYDDKIECRTDPRGHKYYWLAGKFVRGIYNPGTDITTTDASYVSITPLQIDPTAKEVFEVFKQWTTNLN